MIAFLSLLALCASNGYAEEVKRPNIVLFMADDWSTIEVPFRVYPGNQATEKR